MLTRHIVRVVVVIAAVDAAALARVGARTLERARGARAGETRRGVERASDEAGALRSIDARRGVREKKFVRHTDVVLGHARVPKGSGGCPVVAITVTFPTLIIVVSIVFFALHLVKV